MRKGRNRAHGENDRSQKVPMHFFSSFWKTRDFTRLIMMGKMMIVRCVGRYYCITIVIGILLQQWSGDCQAGRCITLQFSFRGGRSWRRNPPALRASPFDKGGFARRGDCPRSVRLRMRRATIFKLRHYLKLTERVLRTFLLQFIFPTDAPFTSQPPAPTMCRRSVLHPPKANM